VSTRIIGGTAASVIAACAQAVAYFEGVIPYTYVDPVGIPTACAGETGPEIKHGQRFTLEECLARLDARLALEWSRVEPCIHRDLRVNEASAILSWSYNVGAYNACTSTLMRKLNAGAAPESWCAELARWDKATIGGVKVVLSGLKKRREKETQMCLGTT
jgi:lysozyme